MAVADRSVILGTVMACVWACMMYCFARLRTFHPRIQRAALIAPLCMIVVHAIDTRDETTQALHDRLRRDIGWSHALPAIVFGVAVLLSRENDAKSVHALRAAIPHLLGALVLGTIIPMLLAHMAGGSFRRADHIAAHETAVFGLQSMSIGLVLAGTMLPMLSLMQSPPSAV